MSAKLTTREFISRARVIHGDKYGYAFSVYQSAHTKLFIYCSEHGMFEQRASNHVHDRAGCPDCSVDSRKLNRECFIEKAREVHGNKYDYSLVEYVNAHKKIVVSCPDHGDFEQTPNIHLRGSGCPGCANYGFDRTKKGYLYILRSDCGLYMKIGITNKPEQRYSQLSKSTPFLFKRIEIIKGPGDQIASLEKEILAEYQPVGFTETFDGYSEWRLWDDSVRNKLDKDLRP